VNRARLICQYKPFKDEAQTNLFKDPSSYRAGNTFHLGYKNQSVYVMWGTIRCFSKINTKHINTEGEIRQFLSIKPVDARKQ
jgi:hypothetical protein